MSLWQLVVTLVAPRLATGVNGVDLWSLAAYLCVEAETYAGVDLSNLISVLQAPLPIDPRMRRLWATMISAGEGTLPGAELGQALAALRQVC